KYLSKMYNDFWMMDQGFLERESFGDLRDLIARRHLDREDFTLSPDDDLQRAVNIMKLYDVSQIAVVERDREGADHIVGILDESDVLLAVTRDPEAFAKPVSEVMTRRLETIAPTARIEDLLPIFRADRVAIVEDEHGRYLGLITKIDLINYLRRQLARS
ncbi:MAG: CBS domain-containing protein, partial [Planctomycetota bacterium]